MMLRELLRKEISSLEPADLNKEVVEKIQREVYDNLNWCSNNFEQELCEKYNELLDKAITSLAKVRILKSIESLPTEESIDRGVITLLDNLLIKYLDASLKGFIDHDGKVPVLIERTIEIKGKIYNKGSVIFMDILEALLLDSLKYLKIITVPPAISTG